MFSIVLMYRLYWFIGTTERSAFFLLAYSSSTTTTVCVRVCARTAAVCEILACIESWRLQNTLFHPSMVVMETAKEAGCKLF